METNFQKFYFKENDNEELIVYIDLDDVLCDFEKQFKKYLKTDLTTLQYIFKYGKKDFYNKLESFGKNYWSQMDWTQDGKELWNYFKPYNPTILSTPIDTIDCEEGKIEWVQKNLGEDVFVILEKNKEKYAKMDALLIDDRIENVEKFIHNKGKAIQHVNTKQTIETFEGMAIENNEKVGN